MQLYEEIVCAQLGNKTPTTTASLHKMGLPMCKDRDNKIAAEVALIVGNQGFFDALPSRSFLRHLSRALNVQKPGHFERLGQPWNLTTSLGILLSIPYGQFADRRGCRPVLLLSCVGIFLAFVWQVCICWMAESIPLRRVWLSSIFMVIGGGGSVMTAVIFAAVADAVDDAQRYVYAVLHPVVFQIHLIERGERTTAESVIG